jgi:hypothetical protein
MMITPKNRAELEHNMALVFEDANRRLKLEKPDTGFIHLTLPELQKVKFLSNGRINLLTVNKSIRLQANMLHNMSMMEPIRIKD